MSWMTDVLHPLEREWADSLRAVSLVAEIETVESDVRDALQALGSLYNFANGWYERDQLLAETFPACLVVGLAGIGALEYEQGNYWTGVWEAVGFAPDPNEQSRWGEAFRQGLNSFDLARFVGLPQKYVGEILMHSGIPGYCLGDLLGLLLRREALDPDLSATEFLAWAVAPGRDSRLNVLDVPVRRFIRFGGDYAEDFIDRCLELLVRLRQPSFEVDGLGLPVRIIKKARELAEDGLLQLGRPRVRERTTRSAVNPPHLLLDPFSDGLQIWLPPVEEAPDGRVLWTVHIDGEVETVRSRSLWPGSFQTAPATSLLLAGPARRALVQINDSEHEYEIELVDPEDPLLIFTEEGRRIPPSSTLPPDSVWLMYPTADTIEGAVLEIHGTATELGEVPTPHGWAGWVLRRVDLVKVGQLRLGQARWRTVQGKRRPRLLLPTPIFGARSVYDTTVLSSAPLLVFPPDPGVTTEWWVRIRRPGSTTSLAAVDYSISSEQTKDPWADLPRPLVGPFEVTVRGPLGRGLRRTVVLAEGLRLESEPAWREIRVDGLLPAIVKARVGDVGLKIDRGLAHLAADEVTAEFTVSGSGYAEVIRVTPPHMAVQGSGHGGSTAWSFRPIRLTNENIDRTQLLIRLPAAMPARLLVRSGQNTVQTVDSDDMGEQPFARFALGRIADTVRKCGSSYLEVQIETLSSPIARCEPARLASRVTLDANGRLVLDGAVAMENVTAGVYQVLAPWREPEVLPVDGQFITVPLPDHLRSAGKIIVALRVEDPWLPVPWPAWPGYENSYLLEAEPWSREPVDPETRLSGHLAGHLPAMNESGAVPFAVPLYLRSDDLVNAVLPVDVRRVAADILGANPDEALSFAAAGKYPSSALVGPLIHAGFAGLPRRRYVELEEQDHLWTTSPLAAVIGAAHQLADPEADELRELLISICGAVGGHLLQGKTDPYAPAGGFDRSAERLAMLSAEQVDTLWRAAAVVPRGLLEADERVAAARELFDGRTRPGVRRVAAVARPVLAELTKLIRQERGEAAARAIQCRGQGEGWIALSALSLALAFAARASADRPGALRDAYVARTGVHAVLARAAPRLVTVDILLAELLIIGAEA